MAVKMRQIGPCFAAEVEGIDLSEPLSPDEVAAVHHGMDEYIASMKREDLLEIRRAPPDLSLYQATLQTQPHET